MNYAAFIELSLAPALAISAAGLMAMGSANRLAQISTRLRAVNEQLRQDLSYERRANLHQQQTLFLHRARMVQYALFLLYASTGAMMMSAIGIAMIQLGWARWLVHEHGALPIIIFLAGLAAIFASSVLQAIEIAISLKTLRLDTQLSAIASERQQRGEAPPERDDAPESLLITRPGVQ